MPAYNFTDLLSVRFLDGGRDPREGLDCWGLVRVCFARAGITLPDYQISCLDSARIDAKIAEQKSAWLQIPANDLGDLAPVLVVMRFNQVELINHTGVYLGAGMFLHTDTKKGVHQDRIGSSWWARHIEGFYIPRKEAARYGFTNNQL